MYCLHCMKRLPDKASLCPFCGQSPRFDNEPHQLRPGTVLGGKYLVGEAIGEGGFGITYIGMDLYLHMRLAIKEFYPFGFAARNHTAGNQVTWSRQTKEVFFREDMDRFLMEARSIARFHGDPNIVEVKNFFKENNTAYIVMEYLDGMNLNRRVSKQGPFEASEAFELFLPLMYSMVKMHEAGVLHRDIAPNNVRLLSTGTLKIMDFGSARYYAGRKDKSLSVLYKEGFSPIEQRMTKGEQGPWTDIYGLCATLYFCITGKIPEDSLNRLQVDGLVKPSKMGVSISSSLEKVLLWGLAVYPKDRCQTMADLIRATERALTEKREKEWTRTRSTTQQQWPSVEEGRPIPEEGSGDASLPRSKRKLLFTGLGLGLGLGLLLLGVFFWKRGGWVSMPSVTGKPASVAYKELSDLGLSATSVYEMRDGVDTGIILGQGIKAGELLHSGDTVVLYVSGESTEVSNGFPAFWGVWIGAEKNLSKANEMVGEAWSLGVEASLVITAEWSELDSELGYMIVAGSYQTEEEAKEHLSEVTQDYPEAYVKYSGDYEGV